jgi:hypothetical protein
MYRTSFRTLIVPAVFLLPASWSSAQTAYPMLMSLRPVAVQAGQAAEVTVSTRYNLYGAYQVMVSGEGVSAEVVTPENKPAVAKAAEAKSADAKPEEPPKKPTVDKLKLRVTAAADALPGIRDIRIATPQGVSTVAQLVVARDPVITESGANDKPAQAQSIELPAAICGAIEKNEDVDYYQFHAEAGQSMVFHVRCARLQDRIHDLQTHADPIVTLRTAAGMTLAGSDNNGYYADPVLAHRFEQEGDYLLEIRDVRYQGNQYWEYCIEANGRPLVECVHPLAVNPGKSESFEPIGHLLAADARIDWTPAAEQALGFLSAQLPLAGEPANPVTLIATDLPLAGESLSANDSMDDSQPLAIPGGVNGRIEREGDIDYYAFEAKKGEAYTLEIIARRAASALDSHMRLLDAKGKQLVLSDDLRLGKRGSSDSIIENWTAPADGKYLVEARDVHLRGGQAFPYFLKITKSEPYFDLYLDSDKSQLVPGGCAALFVRIERKNGFAGEVQLGIERLPPGVTASCGRILEGKAVDGCIVLEAAPDAALAVSNVVVTGTANFTASDGAARELTTTAVPYQETYQPGGGRGHWPVTTHAVAISEPADIRGVTLSTYEVTLKPGESQKIEVTIERSPGFTANVTLDMLMRHLNQVYANTLPPGVTLNDKDAKSLLSGSATQGYLTLTAAKDALPTEKQQAVVVAHVALNFVMKWTYSSRPLLISVAGKSP